MSYGKYAIFTDDNAVVPILKVITATVDVVALNTDASEEYLMVDETVHSMTHDIDNTVTPPVAVVKSS